MNSDQIRSFNARFLKEFDRASTKDELSIAAEGAKIGVLIEIAAQLADLNENIKNKSLSAHCDAHVHIYGDESNSLEGMA